MKNYLAIIALLASGLVYAQPNENIVTKVDFSPIVRAETSLQQQPTFEARMVSAFESGNAEKIASYFSDNVDLSIVGKEDLYSKSQAEQILITFFATHKPKEFKIIHKGKSGQSEYFIGELSAEIIYRVTINSKSSSGSNKINSLTIEAQ